MDECSRQLNQALVERPFRSAPFGQPAHLQHLMRLVKKLAIETFEVAQIMRVEFSPLKLSYRSRNLIALLTHKVLASICDQETSRAINSISLVGMRGAGSERTRSEPRRR